MWVHGVLDVLRDHTTRGTLCDLSGHRNGPEPTSGSGVFPLPWRSGWGSVWLAGGLVVAGRVEGQVAEQFAGGGVDDADVQVLDEQQDVGSGVGSAGADVVELAGVAEGDGAGFADDVGADAVMGVGAPIAGGGLGPGGIRGGGGGPAGQ